MDAILVAEHIKRMVCVWNQPGLLQVIKSNPQRRFVRSSVLSAQVDRNARLCTLRTCKHNKVLCAVFVKKQQTDFLLPQKCTALDCALAHKAARKYALGERLWVW